MICIMSFLCVKLLDVQDLSARPSGLVEMTGWGMVEMTGRGMVGITEWTGMVGMALKSGDGRQGE